MSEAFAKAINSLAEQEFLALYGPWEPMLPDEVADLLPGSGVRWWIAGGRGARVGAPARWHEDTDLVVSLADLGRLRGLLSGWHLWEASDGSLRPLLPATSLTEGCEQLWLRRTARHPWRLDILLDNSGEEWTFKRDPAIRVPWSRALHTVDGVRYLRPELCLLHKAHLDRAKDRADLAAACLDPPARAWLAATLARLGYQAWADLL